MAMQDNLGTIIDQYSTSDKIAVVDRGNRYSYKQFYNDVCSFSAGVTAATSFGNVVAINMFNSYQFAVAYLGIIRAGRVALPVNFKVPADYLEYIYSDSKAVLTITHENFEQYLVGGDGLAEVTKETPALLLYTSGSNTKAKGVVMSHDHKWFVEKKVSENAMIQFRRILIAGPCYHASGLRNAEIGFCGHAEIVLVPDFEPVTIAQAIDSYRPSTIAAVPTVISRILNSPDVVAAYDFSSISVIIAAGAPVSEMLYKQVAEHFPNAKLVNRYGLTEIGPGLFHDHPDGRNVPVGSVGYPLKDIQYRIVNDVLEIKSPSMMLKYNNLPPSSLTADGFYITNDIFRVDDEGFYYFIGRADDMFTNGGNNIYPRQIEIVIESHPDISECVVVGIDDEVKGARPYAIATANGNVPESDLKDLVLAALPPTHCPKRIWIVDQIPLNTVNKIDRKLIKVYVEEKLKNETLLG